MSGGERRSHGGTSSDAAGLAARPGRRRGALHAPKGPAGRDTRAHPWSPLSTPNKNKKPLARRPGLGPRGRLACRSRGGPGHALPGDPGAPPGVAQPTCPGAVQTAAYPLPPTAPAAGSAGPGGARGAPHLPAGERRRRGEACPARACPRVSAPGRARTDSRAPTGSAHGVRAGSGRPRPPPIAEQGGRPDARPAPRECARGEGGARACPGARGSPWGRVSERAPGCGRCAAAAAAEEERRPSAGRGGRGARDAPPRGERSEQARAGPGRAAGSSRGAASSSSASPLMTSHASPASAVTHIKNNKS